MVSQNPPQLKDPVAISAWKTMEMSSRMHRGLSRSAKQANDEKLSRYHHGFEEGLRKAMKILVEKFG